MVDLPLVGGAFTWFDMHEDPLLCRLDRFLLSVDFDILFPNAIQISLTRVISDHKPLMLVTKLGIKPKPYFIFENGWLVHKDFLKKVEEWWGVMEFQGQANFVFFKKLQNLKYFLKNWSREEFGGVKKEKLELTKKIELLDVMEETHKLTKEQFEDRTRCLLRLRSIKSMEARKWQARAKQNEFKWGDSNTSYFNRIASAKKKRNTIAKLDIDGVELEENLEMEKAFSVEEIFDVVKHFGANKAPGPDGVGNRLKRVMHKLVSEFQGAFIKGKQILDGALIAGECVDSRMKSKIPGLLCKIDMEKAFDNVAWSALLRIMQKHGFGRRWISWIKWCVSTSHISVLVNGAYTEKFKPTKGFQVEEEGTVISHLQFADDTLIFVDANVEEVRRLFLILTSFECLTGMKLNLEKSSMISVGVDEVIGDLALELGCKVEKLPFKYLGLPIGATARCTSVWDEVIKRMEVKLATWKKRFLSKAGRLVLIRSCLLSLPVYFLSLIPMPVSVEKKLNKLMRNFLWDSTEERIRMCWVSWLKICKPKHLGGLGS
ncbi:uncharacterized protein LOC113324223 [Papaver somniferum]|uniref:uncharacterized protein LOC113324223 n=1 Tax=Papaver somniferum TaxID=3469 RepID=UPI000E6FFAE2|nr:uncharacterized protein LOC113324223 [Papaver somniferum]